MPQSKGSSSDENEDLPSYWQRKYKRPCNKEDDTLANDLTAWIAETQAKAEELNTPLFTNVQLSLNEPFDEEVAFVISQMETLLSHPQPEVNYCSVPSLSHDNSFDFNNFPAMEPLDQLNCSTLDDGIRFESKLSSLNKEPTTEVTRGSFSTNHIITLFQKTRRERTLRLCIRSLAAHCKREKKRLNRTTNILHKLRHGRILGKTFLLWKNHCRIVRVKQKALAIKFGRASSKQFRQAFAAWKNLSTISSAVETEAVDRCRIKVLTRAFDGWKKIMAAAQDRQKTIQHKALHKSKSRIYRAWRRAVQSIKERARKFEMAQQTYTSRLLKVYFARWLIVSRERLKEDSKPNAATKKAPHKQSSGRAIIDKENQQPNSCLLRPLNTKKKSPSFNSATPKLVIDMEARRRERQERRIILKSKQEEKQRFRKEQDERNRRIKEDEELKLHNTYRQQKAEEEKRKQLEIAHRKQALRLASLHYKITLCRRLFKQWTKIRQVIAFNEQKAHLWWSDLTREKSFQLWRLFKDDEKRRRLALLIKRHRLAEDFNERRLLAKAFAAWEVETINTQQQLSLATHKYSTRLIGSILLVWHTDTVRSRNDRVFKERQAEQYGRRLCLRIALQQWQFGIVVSKKEREISALVQAKRSQVYSWLGEL